MDYDRPCTSGSYFVWVFWTYSKEIGYEGKETRNVRKSAWQNGRDGIGERKEI